MTQTRLKVLRKVQTPDRALVEILVAELWDGTTVQTIMAQVICGLLEAYSTGKCLVLIETVDWPAGRELLIYGMAGRGILQQADDVVADLKALAKQKGCTMIGAHGIPYGWSRIGPRLGFRPVATHYVMELKNGR